MERAGLSYGSRDSVSRRFKSCSLHHFSPTDYTIDGTSESVDLADLEETNE